MVTDHRHRRTGRSTRSATRCSRTGSPTERAASVPDWAIPGEWDEPVVFRSASPAQLYGGDLDGVTEHLDHLDRWGPTCST